MRKKFLIKLIVFSFIFHLGVLGLKSSEAFVYQERLALTKSLAHYAMGQAYDFLGLPSRAILEYEKACQFDEGSYLIHLRLGADYARLDMLDEAIRELKLVGQYNPDELQSHYLLALIYSNQKEYEKAGQEYEYILKEFSRVQPENIDIYTYLGQLYYSQKKYQAAIDQFAKILDIDPENVDIMYLLSSLYLEVGGDEKAINLLKKALKKDPKHDGCLNMLGYIYIENNKNFDEAFKLINQALEINPENGAYLDSLGWYYYQKKDYKNALKYLQQANDCLEDPVIYEHMGDTCYRLNDFEQAKKYWNLSLKLDPDQVNVERKIKDLQSMKASR